MFAPRPVVLLVEDHAPSREATAALLVAAGFEVGPAASAEAALEWVARNELDLLLTDCDLPGRSGEWLVDELERRGVVTKEQVLFMTARVDARAPSGALHKPVSGVRLVRALQERLGGVQRSRTPLETPVASRVLLVLYETGPLSKKSTAQRALRSLLSEFEPPHPAILVRDVALDRRAAARDGIVLTPTLFIETATGTLRRVHGDPTDRLEVIRAALLEAGLRLRSDAPWGS